MLSHLRVDKAKERAGIVRRLPGNGMVKSALSLLYSGAFNFFLWHGDPPWHAPSDIVKLKEKTPVKSQEWHPQSRCQGQLLLALHVDLNSHLL